MYDHLDQHKNPLQQNSNGMNSNRVIGKSGYYLIKPTGIKGFMFIRCSGGNQGFLKKCSKVIKHTCEALKASHYAIITGGIMSICS